MPYFKHQNIAVRELTKLRFVWLMKRLTFKEPKTFNNVLLEIIEDYIEENNMNLKDYPKEEDIIQGSDIKEVKDN